MRRELIGNALILTLVAGGLAKGAEVRTFGKPLAGIAPTSLEQVLDKPVAGKVVCLEGTIEKVCQNKGCWLELKQGAKSVHVTFEGYSFFVPKDSAGQKVTLEGRVVVKDKKSAEVEHMEAEGATAAAARVSIEATGVVIRD